MIDESQIFGAKPIPSDDEAQIFYKRGLQKNKQQVSPATLGLDLSLSTSQKLSVVTSDQGTIMLSSEELLWNALTAFQKFILSDPEIARMVNLSQIGCGVKPSKWENWGRNAQLGRHQGIVKELNPYMPFDKVKFLRRQPFGATQIGALLRLMMKRWKAYFGALDQLHREYNPLEFVLVTDADVITDRQVDPVDPTAQVRDDWKRTMDDLHRMMRDANKLHRINVTIVTTNPKGVASLHEIAPTIVPAYNYNFEGFFREFSYKLSEQSKKLQAGAPGIVGFNAQNLVQTTHEAPAAPSPQVLQKPYVNPDEEAQKAQGQSDDWVKEFGQGTSDRE